MPVSKKCHTLSCELRTSVFIVVVQRRGVDRTREACTLSRAPRDGPVFDTVVGICVTKYYFGHRMQIRIKSSGKAAS